jgi:hypothetical protein
MDEFGRRGDDQGMAKHPQHELFGVRMRQQPTEVMAPTNGRR